MLVLLRKLGERIVVPGCGMTITVLRTKGNKVSLGITAPSGVEIYREELLQRKQEVLTAASSTEVLSASTS